MSNLTSLTELTKLNITQMHNGLIKRDFTSEELTRAHLQEISRANTELNAFIIITEEEAIKRAKAADQRLEKGENISKLTGIPYGIKDIFCTKGVRTTACSKILENFIPSYESTITQKLIDAGAVMLGKLNMDEFAMGSANIYSCFGPTKNPYKGPNGEALVPGGSSGASAAAVAANLAPFTLGSDTGGSVRQPASFCGLVGLRPTYGVCSRFGMVTFASSLDQAGVITRNVADNATVLEIISGYDNKDSTCSKSPLAQFHYRKDENIFKNLRIGIPKECYIKGLSSRVQNLWEAAAKKLERLGAQVIEITLPSIKYSLPVYYIICCAEASSNLARYDGIRYGPELTGNIQPKNIEELYQNFRQGFGNEVKRRILIGTYVLSSGYYDAYYAKARQAQNLIFEEFQVAFTNIDIIINPTCPTEAFGIDAKQDPLSMYMNDIFTVPPSIAGLPSLSIPMGLSENNLPLGLQLAANRFEENKLINVAEQLEQN